MIVLIDRVDNYYYTRLEIKTVLEPETPEYNKHFPSVIAVCCHLVCVPTCVRIN